MSTEKTRAHYEALAAEAADRSDGGPAFPVSTSSKVSDVCGPYGHQDGNSTWQFPGMTLRDYFAAKAMQSIALLPNAYSFDTVQGVEAISANAYDIADAMLKAREVQS